MGFRGGGAGEEVVEELSKWQGTVQRWSREGGAVGQGCAGADTEPGGRDQG